MDYFLLPEITIKILINLPLSEIYSFRLVSKKAKKIVDDFLRLENLVIYNTMFPINYKEFKTYQLFNCTHSIQTTNFDTKLDQQLIRPLFTSIKRLKINDEILFDKSNICDLLNLFKNLKSLDLSCFRILKDEDILKLPNLEILTIHFTLFDGNFNRLILDLPKLSAFKIEYFNNEMNLQFIYPQSINYLQINNYHEIIKLFTNLEILICYKINQLDNDLFNSLPKLKEFYFEDEINLFNNLKNQAQRINKNLKIYLRGIEFESIDNQNFNNENSRSIIELISLNFNKIGSILPYIGYLEYEYLEHFFNNNIPNELVKRLINLKSIFVNQINDIQNFIQFLNCFNSLTWLEIRTKQSKSKLDQQFFDEFLIKKFPNLQFLIIKDNELENLDFNFLFKLNYLISIETNKLLDFNFIENLIKNLKYLSLLRSRFLNYKIKICFYNDNEIELIIKNLLILDENEEKFENKFKLIDYLKNLKNQIY